MKKQLLTILAFIIPLMGGCVSTSSAPPVDKLLFDLKRNVIISQELTLFEEYVKYQKFRHYFSLYSITGLTLNTSIKVEKSSETGIDVTASPSPSAGISNKLKIIATHGGVITLKLIPLGKEYYPFTKKIFEHFRMEIKYVVFYPPIKAFSEKGNPDRTNLNECHLSLYCVPIDGLMDERGRQAWAYLISTPENIGKFRQLEESFYVGLPKSHNQEEHSPTPFFK